RPAAAVDIGAAKTIGAKTAAAGKATAAVSAAVVAAASMRSAAPASSAAARPAGCCAQRQRKDDRAKAPHMPLHKNPRKRCSIFDAQQCASKYGTSGWMLRKRRKNLPDGRISESEHSPRLKIARLSPSRCRTH